MVKTKNSITAAALLAVFGLGSLAVPVEKRLFMALSIDATPILPTPTVPALLDLNNLLPASLPIALPTPPPIPVISQIESTITQVIGDVTSLILTSIPISTPTPLPVPIPDASSIFSLLMSAFPSLASSDASGLVSFLESATSVALPEQTPSVNVPTPALALPAQTPTPTPTDGVINPLTLLPSGILPTDPAAPASSAFSEITSVINGATSVLAVPAAFPTALLPLLGSMKLPNIDLPDLLGNKQDTCVSDDQGNQIGICNGTPVVNDAETISIPL